jgi:hypothetical protein
MYTIGYLAVTKSLGYTSLLENIFIIIIIIMNVNRCRKSKSCPVKIQS